MSTRVHVVGTLRGHEIMSDGTVYHCPSLALWSFRSESGLVREIMKKLGKERAA